MKKLFFIINTIFFQFIIGQHTNKNVTHFYENNKVEKVYLHLNNVLYEPEEVVHYKIYVTNADNSPSNWSDYVYVEIFDASNKKIETQNYLVQNGSALGSFTLKKEIPAGIYKIKAYTKWQNIVSDVAFETSFFVQKISSPRLLMSLEFKKKGYGKGATCEADFELKNIENQPIKNYRFKYEIFIAGKKVTILSGQTNEEGKALLVFDLPEQLTSTDGIINLLVDYDNYQESITRSIPINLNFVDLQFLPESGQFVVNETCTVFFIAKNEFGLPLDVSGTIVNQDDEVVANFSSFHDGMGKFKMNAKQGQTYFAKITSPFVAEKIIKLPEAVNNAFVINALENNPIVYKIFSPQDSDGKILIRNTDKIHQTIQLNLDKGWNEVAINPKNLPVGIQNISLVIKDKIVAEKLAFFNYQNGLNIDIKTDKLSYLPREKVKVTINTTDSDKKAIPSNLSVSVVDNKLVTYMNDKQHTILSWMFLGFELKGKIHEPSFYFDEKIALDKRLLSIDLLLNTHGWRKYNQEDIIDLKYPQTQLKPERNNDIEGFLSDENNKPVVAKILLFTDDEKVYETKSDAKGYFKFTKTYFAKFAYLVIKNNRKKDIKDNKRYS